MYRKDFTQLTAVELTRLADGFNHLWANGTIQANANLHAVNFNGGIIHWCPSFLPWHRDFLRKIEIELQNFDARITLPYWDWTRADSRDLNSGVWQSFFGGRSNTGGNFDHWTYTRRSHANGNVLPTLADIIGELKENTYYDYRSMESGSHVPGHTWTGNTMASGQSPLDPLFYLHHCNLDRLWAIWQEKNPSAAQYDTTIGLSSDITPNPNVVGLNQSMQVGTTVTPASVLDHTTLGYLYERDILLEIAWFQAENTSLLTGDKRQPDLFISDSASDVGDYPSPIPHWASPDIWVRNQDPTTPGENPLNGHQAPIVNQVNYLYVKVRNRGTNTANDISVEAYHCNPGTGMLWPDDFNTMGTLPIVGTIAGGNDVVVGPFLWTPTVLNHECLLAIVSSPDDPSVTSTTPSEPDSKSIFHQSVPHWHLVRFENNVGQRNVSPISVVPGGRMSTSIRVRGGIIKTSNDIEIDAEKIPKDTEILVIVPNSLAKAKIGKTMKKVSANSRYTTFKLAGNAKGVIKGFDLSAREDKTIKLKMDFSKEAIHKKTYPLVVSQHQDDKIAGRITFDITAIKESEDYVYGNPRSKELHTTKCPYWNKISDKNKIPFENIKDGIARGYNGCAFCLPKFDTD